MSKYPLKNSVKKSFKKNWPKICQNRQKRSPFFPSLWGYWGELTIYIEIFLRFLVYLHKLSIQKNFINNFFFKKLKKKFRFFLSKGSPLWISQKLKKNFINKHFSYAQFMKVHQFFSKNSNVYGEKD